MNNLLKMIYRLKIYVDSENVLKSLYKFCTKLLLIMNN